jgi:3-deoxy-D-manno-octulosonic-acid transferase
LLLIMVPRDPHRAEAVCRIFRSGGRFAVRRSGLAGAPDDVRPDVMVVDAMGLLSRIYGLSHAAFVGGSLVDAGGHNPLEPASLAKPVVFGPHTEDFSEICRQLQDAGGAFRIHSVDALENTLALLLEDPSVAGRAGRRAFGVVEANRGATARNVDGIARMLAAAGRSPRGPHPTTGGGVP